MPDQGTIDSVAQKFQAWAESLPTEEQSTLAEWLGNVGDEDVTAHWRSNWWQESGAWSRAWADSWSS